MFAQAEVKRRVEQILGFEYHTGSLKRELSEGRAKCRVLHTTCSLEPNFELELTLTQTLQITPQKPYILRRNSPTHI